MCIFFKDKKSKKVKVSKKNPEIKFEIKNASKAPHPRTCQKLIYKKYFFGYYFLMVHMLHFKDNNSKSSHKVSKKKPESDTKIKKPTNKQFFLSSGMFSSSSETCGSVRVLSSMSSGSITAGPKPYRALWEFQKCSWARFFLTTDLYTSRSMATSASILLW